MRKDDIQQKIAHSSRIDIAVFEKEKMGYVLHEKGTEK